MVLGIKEELIDVDGKLKTIWNTNGHRDRIIEIGHKELALFARLYDEAGTDPLEARLPALHARQLRERALQDRQVIGVDPAAIVGAPELGADALEQGDRAVQLRAEGLDLGLLEEGREPLELVLSRLPPESNEELKSGMELDDDYGA